MPSMQFPDRRSRAVILLVAVVSGMGSASWAGPSAARQHANRAAYSAVTSSSLVGHRAKVSVHQLLIYKAPGKGSYIGSLQNGQFFKVVRLNRDGTWAYGSGVAKHALHGWVKSKGLMSPSA